MKRFRLIYYSLLVFVTALAVTSIVSAETIIVPNQNVEVVIDVDACAMPGHLLCGE